VQGTTLAGGEAVAVGFRHSAVTTGPDSADLHGLAALVDEAVVQNHLLDRIGRVGAQGPGIPDKRLRLPPGSHRQQTREQQGA